MPSLSSDEPCLTARRHARDHDLHIPANLSAVYRQVWTGLSYRSQSASPRRTMGTILTFTPGVLGSSLQIGSKAGNWCADFAAPFNAYISRLASTVTRSPSAPLEQFKIAWSTVNGHGPSVHVSRSTSPAGLLPAAAVGALDCLVFSAVEELAAGELVDSDLWPPAKSHTANRTPPMASSILSPPLFLRGIGTGTPVGVSGGVAGGAAGGGADGPQSLPSQ